MLKRIKKKVTSGQKENRVIKEKARLADLADLFVYSGCAGVALPRGGVFLEVKRGF